MSEDKDIWIEYRKIGNRTARVLHVKSSGNKSYSLETIQKIITDLQKK